MLVEAQWLKKHVLQELLHTNSDSTHWSLKYCKINWNTVTEYYWRRASSICHRHVQFQEGESVFWLFIAHWGAWCQNRRSLFWRVGFRVTWVPKHLQEPLETLQSANYSSAVVPPIHWSVKASESKTDRFLLSFSLIKFLVVLNPERFACVRFATNWDRISAFCCSQSESLNDTYLPIPSLKHVFDMFLHTCKVCA